MRSENFDKKLKDILSQRPPGNDNPDWDKMEMLLDKHLPAEKKDRRRVFIILFSFLLLGGGAFLIWQNSNGGKDRVATIDSPEQNVSTSEINGQTKTNPDKNITPSINAETNKVKAEGTGGASSPVSFNAPANEIEIDASVAKVGRNKKAVKDNSVNSKNDKADQTIEELIRHTEPERTLIEKFTSTEPQPTTGKTTELTKETEVPRAITENKPGSHKVEEQKSATKENKPVTVEKSTTAKKKNNSSFANNFFVTVSAGPDMSGVGGNAGEVRLAYGAGLGYQVSKKFSVRTGIYAARKVYTADPEDYNPPYNFWAYYPNLKNIDANCMVYEIPVTVDYKISSNKKQSWFVSAGVSSLLMKEETYEYYYKPNSSPTYITYTKTINNQNKHYFSVLNLSGGYTRGLNKNISLQAEPYVKLSMTGVGYGKVDLNSGGVLFSAIIRPFAKK